MSILVRRFLFLLNLLLFLYTLLVFQLSYKADVQHWLAGFLMLSMPFVLFLNILFVIFWLLLGSKRWILSLLVLLLGYPFLKRTFSWHPPTSAKTVVGIQKKISVLSYNMMWCDFENYYQKHDSTAAWGIVNLAIDSDADIKCFQELFNLNNAHDFQLLNKLRKKNPYSTYVHATPGNDNGQGEIGLAIFSKYPILHKKEVYWKTNHNGILIIDLLIAHDTIRVINTQLKSMGIRVEKLIESRDNKNAAEREAKSIFKKLKEGFINRVDEAKTLENWVKDSPYPTLLCGDFNELPYGYAYGRVRKHLKNAFEEAGNGFGFTYNRPPNYLRIDNQFYGKGLIIKQFRTLSEINYSDHYPIYGEYFINGTQK